AISCAKDNEKGWLWMAARWQVSKLLPQIADCDLRLALVHHPDSWLSEFEGKLFQDLSAQVTFLHHGHEHDQWIDPWRYSGGPMRHIKLAGGSLYERSNKPNGNGYSVITWDPSTLTATVYLREYAPQGRGWRPR